MKVANKEMSVRKLWTSNELLDAVSARKAGNSAARLCARR